MFTVKIDDNTIIHNPLTENILLADPVVKLEVNKAGSFRFTMPPTHPSFDDIKAKQTMIDVYQDDDCIFSGIVSEEELNFYNEKVITCEGALSFLADTIHQPEELDGTAKQIIQNILANHNARTNVEGSTAYNIKRNISLGVTSIHAATETAHITANMASNLSLLQELIKLSPNDYIAVKKAENGLEMQISAKRDIMDISLANTQTVQVGKNLIDFSRRVDSEVFTKLIPLGAKVESGAVKDERLTIKTASRAADWMATGASVATYGNTYQVKIWDTITDADELYAAAQAYIQTLTADNITIDATAFDLSIADADFEKIKLLDKIRVVSVPHDLDIYLIVTKQEIDLNQPGNNTITLGDIVTQKISERV